MSLIFDPHPTATSSSDSLLTVGGGGGCGEEDDDIESQIPQPEPLGTSKALSPAVQHKWWWRKKPVIVANNNNNNNSLGTTISGCKSPPKSSKLFKNSSSFSFDGKFGLILGLLVVLALTTLITVQFHDSELILALFTALALTVLGLVYYFQCCSSPSHPFSWRTSSSTKTDFSPLSLPSAASSPEDASSIAPVVAASTVTDESRDLKKKTSMEDVLLTLPATANTTVSKPSPHRRDWSLPTMPTGALLSHRRPSHQQQQQQHQPQQSQVFSLFEIPSHHLHSNEFSKLRIEFSLEDPVGSRIQHVSTCLQQLLSHASGSNSAAMTWTFEGRLADAITAALTSCMSKSQLTLIKQGLDRELRKLADDGGHTAGGGGSRYSTLHSAVFNFLQKGERDAILTHFSAVHHVIDDEPSCTSVKRRLLISDIDDTLVPTFKDRRGFSWGVPYPGVRQLYKELVGTDEDETILLRERVAFVTARPGLLRTWTEHEVSKAGFEGSLVLMGFASTATTPQGMLAQKVKQVRELRSLWPECSIVLVGDNGQRDIDLGALLMKENLVEAVFIHDIFASEGEEITRTRASTSVTENSPPPPPLKTSLSSSNYDDEEEEEEGGGAFDEDRRLASVQPKTMVRLISAPAALGSLSNEMAPMKKRTGAVFVLEPSRPVGFRHDECSRAGIDLFQTYAGAALKCHQKGLLSIEALERVARACAVDLGATSIDGLVKQRLVDSLLRDVARVALEFKEKTPGEKVEFLEFVHESIKKRTLVEVF